MSSSSPRLDLDEIARLEEERDHLLASLEDLDREFAAGDMDELDHRTLRDDYTTRAAAVLEALDQQHAALRAAAPPRRPATTIAIAALVVVLAVGTGVFVARSSGQRGDGPITGAVNNQRSELARCQTISFQQPEEGIDCYAEILADAPDQIEALTYQGWAKFRSGDVDGGTENFRRVVELDPEYPDVRVFRAVVAARAGDHELAAEEIDVFYRNDPSPAAQQVLASQGLEREIFVLTLDPATRGCWQDAAQDVTGEATDAATFITSLGDCLDGLLATTPDLVDALVSRAYVTASVGDLPAAVALAERAVAADPTDANALLIRASLAAGEGRVEDAEADLAVVEGLQRPTASFLVGSPQQLREAIDEGITTTTAPSSDAPSSDGPTSSTTTTVDAAIPNPSGG